MERLKSYILPTSTSWIAGVLMMFFGVCKIYGWGDSLELDQWTRVLSIVIGQTVMGGPEMIAVGLGMIGLRAKLQRALQVNA